jgi:hypothetical protein
MASEDKFESVSEKKTESVSEKKTESGTHTITEVISEKKTETLSGTPPASGPEDRSDLLDPLTAVRLVWAITGGFPTSRLLKKKDEADIKDSDTAPTTHVHYSNINADEANDLLTKIVTESEKHEKEKEYITKSVIAMRAALRNLGTIYNGRELNFKENETLRDSYIKSITDSIEFGKAAKDFITGVPAAIIGALGSVGVSLILSNLTGVELNATDLYLIAVVFGLLGFLYYWFQMKVGHQKNFRGLMQQELERDIYYRQYLYRAHLQLQSLFTELNTIHRDVFKKPYSETSEKEGKEAITNLITNLCPTGCENLRYCAYEHRMDKDWWAWCETGVGDSCLTMRKPPNPEECNKDNKDWPPFTNRVKYFIKDNIITIVVVAIVIAVLCITAYFAFFATPGTVVTLEKTSSVQDLMVNRSLNISVALMNRGSSSITDITIEDTVPEGFNLTGGNTSLEEGTLEQGGTLFLNYTLQALVADTYNLSPAKASYTVSGGARTISSNAINITVSEEGNTTRSS